MTESEKGLLQFDLAPNMIAMIHNRMNVNKCINKLSVESQLWNVVPTSRIILFNDFPLSTMSRAYVCCADKHGVLFKLKPSAIGGVYELQGALTLLSSSSFPTSRVGLTGTDRADHGSHG